MKLVLLTFFFIFSLEISCQTFNGNLVISLQNLASARSVASSSIYNETAIGFQNGEVRIYTNTGSFLRSFQTQFGNGINALTYLANGDIATAGFTGTKLYTNDGLLKQSFTSMQGNTIVVLQNGDLAFNSMNEIFIWDPNSNVYKFKLNGHIGVVFSLLALPNGDLISGAEDGTIRIWDTSTGSLKSTLTDSDGWTRSLVLLDDGNVISGSDFGRISRWDIDASAEVLRIKTDHKGLLTSVIVLPNGQIASSSRDRTIKIWNKESGDWVKTLTDGHNDWIMQMVVNSDSYLVSVGYDGKISFWN